MREQALELLRQAVGEPNASFRPGQFEAISALVERRARRLVVQRTGWGKSVVYFLATRFLRDRGAGCTILISPLLSLMRNQIAAANNIGIRAETINSANTDDWPRIEDALNQDQVDLLLISPERLANDDFVQRSLLPMSSRIGLFVVDEAHCISDWGHDFRPDYRRIVRILRALPANMPVLATTATANDRVVDDIVEQLGPRLAVQRGPLTRASLGLQNIYLRSQAERLAWLANIVPNLEGSGVIYTLTVKDSERVAEWLQSQGVDAEPYNGQMQTEEREALETRLLNNEVKALAATVALGMGFDKPDLGFVIHFQRPASAVHYYQQVGRAGRAVDHAFGILLNGEEDDDIADYFIRTAFPTPDDVNNLLAAMEAAGGPLKLAQLEQRLNLSRGQITKALKFLSLESPAPVQKVGAAYVLNPVNWTMPVDRIERITTLRRHEQRRMRSYMQSRECLMRFLASELSDSNAAPCGKCANCAGKLLPEDFSTDLAQAAVEFLNHVDNPIPPRRTWPPGLDDPQMKGRISEDRRALEGRVLCRWGDPGLGALVRTGKRMGLEFDARLVEASARLIRHRWRPDPAPGWLTWVPSRRRRTLVPGFAKRLAERLAIPFVECIEKVRETLPQKTRANSFQQVLNLKCAFRIDTRLVRPEPVLLVDDIVDSRWTFTVLSAQLRDAGSGPVLPFALGDSSSEDSG